MGAGLLEGTGEEEGGGLGRALLRLLDCRRDAVELTPAVTLLCNEGDWLLLAEIEASRDLEKDFLGR